MVDVLTYLPLKQKELHPERKVSSTSLSLQFFYYFCSVIVITLEHNNKELRNTNGCNLVTHFSNNPTNRFILSKLSLLAKITKINSISQVI